MSMVVDVVLKGVMIRNMNVDLYGKLLEVEIYKSVMGVVGKGGMVMLSVFWFVLGIV